MKFGIEKCAILIIRSGKTNDGKKQNCQIKKKSERWKGSLKVLQADIIKQAEMEE